MLLRFLFVEDERGLLGASSTLGNGIKIANAQGEIHFTQKGGEMMPKQHRVLKTLLWSLCFVFLSCTFARADEKKEEPPKYVGVKTCKGCHKDQFQVWEKTKMAGAFELLKTDAAKKISKDADKDPKCVACHVTGFNAEGGYKIPDESKKEEVDKAKALEGVQCENCHGPGAKYVPVMGKAMGGKALDTKAAQEAGLVIPDETTCQKCHSKESPFFDEKKWNFEEAKKTIAHPKKKSDK